MPEFSLRSHVREVLANSTQADPRAIAAEAFDGIDPNEYGPALLQCLPDVVREEIRHSRNLAPVGTMQERPRAVGDSLTPRKARSSKVASIREMWQEKLRERIHTGPSSADWRMLGDCSFDELMFAAAERRELAARNEAKATEYEELAEMVRTAGVGRVRDLPAALLRTRLESEAA
jgi:hypothetical protein